MIIALPTGNLNINTSQANNNQSQSQHTPDGIKSEPINRITQRNPISPAFIMDLSTEQSHVKQRLARFYQQTAASESNNNNNNNNNHNQNHNHNNNNSNSHNNNNNNSNNHHQQQQQQHQVSAEPLNHVGINPQQSSHTSLTSAAASASNSSSTVQVNCTTSNRLNTVLSSGNRITTSDHGQLNQWNDGKSHSQPVPTITSSNTNGINGNQGHVHHTSLTPSQCSLSSPPPPPDSPAMSGISSSASNSSISSPFSRQMDTETSVSGYTSIISESGSKKRKRRPQPIPDNCKDDAYWERRKRNNESAKRSRELRRYKEQQTTMRVIYLEQDNLKLKTEVDMLRTELEKLREILFTRNNNFH